MTELDYLYDTWYTGSERHKNIYTYMYIIYMHMYTNNHM
jgi:hypothetical protein